MDTHSICREMLREQMVEVRKHFTQAEIAKAWAWTNGRDFEFHGPNKEYLYSFHGDCLWSVKAEAWGILCEKKERT